MKRLFNFSAGPASLPQYVLDAAARDIYSFEECGIGIMELSHRSKEFEGIMQRTDALFRELLNIPGNYKVLFTTGGGTNLFSMIPLNLNIRNSQANYILSGFWAERAATEASKFCNVHIAASSKEINYRELPRELVLSNNPSYLHFTSNNTIYGTQAVEEPDCPDNVPLICDASSDFLSREIEITKYAAIYGAAQKNAGTAGVSVLIIREDLLSRSINELPVMMNFKTYAENNSLYNTAPTFSIYICMRTLEWLKGEGGITEMARRAAQRAKIVYDAIDKHDLYVPYVAKNSRSKINLTFHLKDDSRTADFLKQANERGLKALAGYRLLGGVRASMYNAFPTIGAEALAHFMDDFAKR